MNKIIQGDALTVLKTLPDQCVQTAVSSPPYYSLRDYGIEGQLGLEDTPEEYVARMVDIFREVRRVLKDNGTLWLNLGDSYATDGLRTNTNGVGSRSFAGNPDNSFVQKHICQHAEHGVQAKNLIGIPWRVAFALQADGWYLRQDIIWHKPNPMPESVTDRCTKAHEYIFLLSKSQRYYFDNEAIREEIKSTTNGSVSVRPSGDSRTRDKEHWGIPHEGRGNVTRTYTEIKGANKRSVWTVATKPYKHAHLAAFPPDLIRPCILAGAPTQHTVLDPFMGSGTTAVVAKQLHRHYLGIELNPAYIDLARERLGETRLENVA